MTSENSGSGFFAGFLLGGLVGGALALLFSPRSGEETRDTLVDRGIELKSRAEEVAAKAREEADELITRGRTVFEEQKGRVQEAVEEGKEAAAQKRAELLAKYRFSKETGVVPPTEQIRREGAAGAAPLSEEEQKPEEGAGQ